MKTRFLQIFLAFVLMSASCKKATVATYTPPVITPVTATNLITLPAGWKVSTTLGSAYPAGIQVYEFDTIFQVKRLKAVCVAYDSKNANFELKPALSATSITPSAYAAAEPGITYATINGGYFGGGQSFSLVKYNNVVSSPNIKALTRVFNATNTSYYPTRAAFGIISTGAPSAAWVYSVGAGNDNVFAYPAPSPNLVNTAPQPVPTATFPAGGGVWNTISAIGGSPMLVYNSNIQITDNEELIVIDNAGDRPRSAIGYTASGIVMVMAVEGDNPPSYRGINLPLMAELMRSMGNTHAVNLDGGGSTSLVIGGTRAVRPGDSGVERPVMSVVMIKKK